MPNARSILENKPRQSIFTVPPTATVVEAAVLMNDAHIGSLLVVDDGELVGIFTERDILRRIVAARRDPATTPVSQVMTSAVACATPHTTRAELGATMREKCIRHLPVLEESKLVGLISIGDLNRSENNEQAQTIRYLEQYMSVG